MKKVLLFKLESENIKVSIEAYFDENQSLIITGYDIGKSVKEFWGDSDYEYSTTVLAEDVRKLYSVLNIDHQQEKILAWLLENYHENDCYSKIRNFLSQNKILYSTFSWN